MRLHLPDMGKGGDTNPRSQSPAVVSGAHGTLPVGKPYTDEVDFTWMCDEEVCHCAQFPTPVVYGCSHSAATSQQPHRSRRMEILKKHPEIKKLYGHEPKTKYMVAVTVLLQTYLAVKMIDSSWPVFLAVAYFIGATCNHSLFLAIHEWSHNLGFKSAEHNKMASMFANLPIGFPYSASFKPYHMDHHRNQVSRTGWP